jgi:hypothetical protein
MIRIFQFAGNALDLAGFVIPVKLLNNRAPGIALDRSIDKRFGYHKRVKVCMHNKLHRHIRLRNHSLGRQTEICHLRKGIKLVRVIAG